MKKMLLGGVVSTCVVGLLGVSFLATSKEPEPEVAVDKAVVPPVPVAEEEIAPPVVLAPAEGAEHCATPDGQLVRCHLLIDCGPGPKGIAFSPDSQTVWVSILNKTPSVEVYAVSNGEKLKTITLGKDGAVEVVFSHDGQTAFVSQMQTDSVYEIDATTYEVRKQHTSGNRWTKVIAESRDGRFLYSSGWISGTVSVLDRTGELPTKSIRVAKTPRGLYLSPDEAWLYVASFGSGKLQRINTQTHRVENVYQGGVLRHLVGDAQGEQVFVSDMRRGRVVRHDIASKATKDLARTDANPNTIDLTPDGKVLAVSCRGRNNPKSYHMKGPEFGSVLLFDTQTGRKLDGIVAGNQPTGLDVSPDGKWLATTDLLDARVRLYALPESAVLVDGDGGRADVYKAEMRKKGSWSQ